LGVEIRKKYREEGYAMFVEREERGRGSEEERRIQ
jgi:hypothetical protein